MNNLLVNLKADGFSFTHGDGQMHYEFVHEGVHVKSDMPIEYWSNPSLVAVTLLETPMAKAKLSKRSLNALMALLDVDV